MTRPSLIHLDWPRPVEQMADATAGLTDNDAYALAMVERTEANGFLFGHGRIRSPRSIGPAKHIFAEKMRRHDDHDLRSFVSHDRFTRGSMFIATTDLDFEIEAALHCGQLDLDLVIHHLGPQLIRWELHCLDRSTFISIQRELMTKGKLHHA